MDGKSKGPFVGAITFVILVALVAFLYWDSAASALAFWRTSHNYQHGLLLIAVVLVVAAWDLANHAPRLDQLRPISLLALLSSGIMLALSTISTTLVSQILFLIVIVWCLIWAVFGWASARRLMLLFLVALVAVPAWDFLVPVLQQTAVLVVNYFLDVFRRTSYIEGDYVFLRYGSFHIEEACSGMNFLVSGIMLSGLYAYFFQSKWTHRLVAIVAGGAAAILGNWIRIFAIVMAGDLSQMQHSLVEDHIGFGWFVFAVMVGLMLLLEYRLTRSTQSAEDKPEASRQQSDRSEKAFSHGPVHSLNLVGAGLALAAISLPALTLTIVNARAGEPNPIAIVIDNSVGAYAQEADWNERKVIPRFAGARAEAEATFLLGQGVVVVGVFAYDARDTSTELVGYPNYWYDSSLWESRQRDTIGIEDSSLWPSLNVWKLKSGGDSFLLIGGYIVNDTVTAHPVVAKVLTTIGFLSGNYAGAALAVSMRCGSDCEVEREELEAFATSLYTSDSVKLVLQ